MNKRNVIKIDVGKLSLKEAKKVIKNLKYKMKYKKAKPIEPKWRTW